MGRTYRKLAGQAGAIGQTQPPLPAGPPLDGREPTLPNPALLTRREGTITLLVRTTNGSALMCSTTCSKCRASAARICSSASASPVIVAAPVASGYLLTAAAISAGEVRPRQNSST